MVFLYPFWRKKAIYMTWETSKIWNIVREKGDVDDMIFADENGANIPQPQVHSDR